MKKLAILLLVLLLPVPADAADKLSPDAAKALQTALQNEREAAIRYQAFVAKAVEEGYPGAANLFRACAAAEKIHARRFKSALEKYKAEVPAPPEYTPTVGTTPENLRASISGEQSERDITYREAAEVAKEGGNPDVARIFEVTRDTETEHANLLAAANMSSEKLKKAKAYWVCDVCGYTTDVHLPMCPSCRSSHDLDEIEP